MNTLHCSVYATLTFSKNRIQSSFVGFIPRFHTIDAALYPVFRKRFHIPQRWAEEVAFKELAEHRYEKDEHLAAFDFIESRLKKLNLAGATFRSSSVINGTPAASSISHIRKCRLS